MDKINAQQFLENFIDRIQRDPESGKWKLDGIITDKEYQALMTALESLGGVSQPTESHPEQESLRIEKKITPPGIPLNRDSLALEEPEHPEILLCLDFGTAMSKAFATEEHDDELLPLEIGRQAGQDDPVFALVSSVFISNSGKILFGQRAISESTHADISNRRRFDSIKDILCKDVVSNLDEAPLEDAYNPSNIPLTKGDMVTLFLAYFTDMATSLVADKGYSRYVRRRFTRPVLPPDRAPWAEDQLSNLLARAQVLADTLHGTWQEGIDVAQAKQLMNAIRNLDELPNYLIDSGVVEPVAAVGSRFRNLVCKTDLRRLLMVIDVGAGTIDYALFAELERAGEAVKVWEIPGSLQVLRQAGDAVDKLLRRYVLKKADVTTTDSDFNMIDAALSLRIRQLKEQLFVNKKVKFYLTNDRTGEITLGEFLEYPGVQEFEKAIRERFVQALNDVHPTWITSLGVAGGLAVIFTGGGASLPMVRALAKGDITVHGTRIPTKASTPIPSWVLDDYPELANEFPQLAVAIGGASRNLPVLAPQAFQEFGGLEADGWSINPAYKGT